MVLLNFVLISFLAVAVIKYIEKSREASRFKEDAAINYIQGYKAGERFGRKYKGLATVYVDENKNPVVEIPE